MCGYFLYRYILTLLSSLFRQENIILFSLIYVEFDIQLERLVLSSRMDYNTVNKLYYTIL